MVWTPDVDVSWPATRSGFSLMSYREEVSGQTQDALEGLNLSVGLGMPRHPPQRVGRGSWGEAGLGISPEARDPNPGQVADNRWMEC